MPNNLNIEITNRIEGPILQRRIEMNLEEWKSRLDPRTTDDKTIPYDINVDEINPFRKKILDLLRDQSGGDPKEDALYLALANPHDSAHAYRCFVRNISEPDPFALIQSIGYDKPLNEDDMFMYSINEAWFLKLYPKENLDTNSYILVYKNDPNVLAPDQNFIHLRNHDPNSLSLRDILVGVVKIDWK